MLPRDKNKIEEYKKNISKRMVGNNNPVGCKRTKEHIEIIKRANTLRFEGKPTWSSTHKDEMSKKMIGKKNPSWKGGITKIKYESRDRINSNELSVKLSKLRKGELNPSWKGGITPENLRIRRSIEYRLWREAVFARDNWTCQKAGIKGGILHTHHIQNFAQFPELRFAIDNGITLSRESHKEFHKKYGIKNNTKEQIALFIENWDERNISCNQTPAETGPSVD